MKTIKTILFVSVFALITAFTLKTSEGYNVGDVASDFSLENIDGKMPMLIAIANLHYLNSF
mgnify:CR=1 FL=1